MLEGERRTVREGKLSSETTHIWKYTHTMGQRPPSGSSLFLVFFSLFFYTWSRVNSSSSSGDCWYWLNRCVLISRDHWKPFPFIVPKQHHSPPFLLLHPAALFRTFTTIPIPSQTNFKYCSEEVCIIRCASITLNTSVAGEEEKQVYGPLFFLFLWKILTYRTLPTPTATTAIRRIPLFLLSKPATSMVSTLPC